MQTRQLGVVLVSCLISACAMQEPAESETTNRPGREEGKPLSSPGDPWLLAVGDGPSLVVIDASSGERLSETPLARLPVEFGALGPGRVFVHVVAAEEEEGFVDSYEISDDGALSISSRLASTQGEPSMRGLGFGLLALQPEDGPRWRLMPLQGGFMPSVACPLPDSLSVGGKGGEDSRALRALVSHGPGMATLVEMAADASGLGDCSQQAIVGLDPTAAPTVLFESEHLGLALIGAAQERLSVWCLGGPKVSAKLEVASPADRPLAVNLLDDSLDSARLAVLFAEPPTLGVLSVSVLTGEPPQLASQPLPPLAAPTWRWADTALAVVGRHIVVATEEGLLAFEPALGAPLWQTGELRGPIATVPRRAN